MKSGVDEATAQEILEETEDKSDDESDNKSADEQVNVHDKKLEESDEKARRKGENPRWLTLLIKIANRHGRGTEDRTNQHYKAIRCEASV